MKTLEKYEDIKVSMLPEKTRDTLEKLQKATKNFTIENDKAIAYVNAVHSKLSKEKPEYLRSTTAKPEPKPEPKKAEPKKPTVKKAVAKKAEPKKQVAPKPTPKPKITKTQIKTAAAKINTLQLAIQSDPLLQGLGKTDKERDAARLAQPKGRRVSKVGWKNQYGASKGGRTYYESRENRSDRKSPEYKSGYPYLEMGGYTHRLDGAMMADGKYYVIDAKDGKILSKGFDTEEEAKVEKYKIFENTGIFSLTQKKMADGGMMANGGEVGEYFTIAGMNEKLNRMFPDSFGFSVGNFSDEGNKSRNSSALIANPNDPFRGLKDSDIGSKLFFPQYKQMHDIRFRIYQGGENTYFYFNLESEKGDEYLGQFGFKDGGYVPSSYITRFIAFLMEQYGLPFEVNHSVMADGGFMAQGGKIDEKEKLSNISYQLINTTESFKKNNPEAYSQLKDEYKAQFIKVYGEDEYNKRHVMAKGGAIENQYEGREAEDIWNNLTFGQRLHFLTDHNDDLKLKFEEKREFSRIKFDSLNKNIQDEFAVHTMMGQYADGGFMAKGGEMGKIDEIEGDEINMAFNDFDDYAYGGMTKFDWEKAEIGDSALVIAENKMGVIVKTYGRRFHLRFPDGSDKTYSAEELKFFLDEEYAKGGSMKRGSELSQGDINKKVIENIEQYLNYSNNRNERLYVIREIFKEALVDANFGEYQNKIDEIFLGAKKFVVIKNGEETEQLLFQVGQQVANVCGWDRFKISDAIKYTLSMNGFATLANKIDNMYDSTPQKLIYTSKANIKYFLIKNENKSKAFNSIYEIYEPKDVFSGVYKLAKGGELKDAKYYAKDKVIIIGLDGKIITKVNGAWVKKTAKPIGEIEKSDALDAAQDNSWNKYSDKTTKTKKAIIVTSIKDIPNFDKRLDEGKITYRGLGMGKLSNDFFKETGTSGVRIKVDGKEYFITDEEFATFSRGADGKLIVRFAAPYRKSYEQGGEVKSSEKLPYKLDKYFTKGTKTIEVPLTQLFPTRARETGIENAEKFMRMAYNGDMERRTPISIYLISKGKYKIADGNSTFAVAKKNGWKTIYADVVKNPKSQSNGKKSVFSIAKEIRKDGESWQSAIQRAKSMK